MSVSGAQPDLRHLPRFRACVALGGNLGDVRASLQGAVAALRALPATEVEAVSSLYRTRPVDAGGPDYLNAAAVLQTSLGPQELLRALQAIELSFERERAFQNAPRTLDLDLLWHGGLVLHTPTLTLPHPRMHLRAFVLWPLSEALAALGSLDPALAPALPSSARQAELAREQGIERLPSEGWADGA